MRIPKHENKASLRGTQKRGQEGEELSSEGGSSSLRLSAAAQKRIAIILTQTQNAKALRISVEGGGCAGFQYKYTLVADYTEEDLVLQAGDAVVVIDPLSANYLAGSEIDFVDTLMGQSFQIHNPNARSGCGCGTSFSLF